MSDRRVEAGEPDSHLKYHDLLWAQHHLDSVLRDETSRESTEQRRRDAMTSTPTVVDDVTENDMGYHCGRCSEVAGWAVIYTPSEYAAHACPSVPAVTAAEPTEGEMP